MKLVVVAAIACARVARADAELPTIDSVIQPRIAIGSARDVAVERGDVLWVSFEVPAWTSRPIAIDVPRGTLVVGMKVGASAWGAPVTALHDRSVVERVSGAVLSWDSASGDVDHLVLAHAPRNCGSADVISRCSERLTLALVLPAIASVQVFPRPARVDGKPAKTATIALPPPRELDTVPAHVDVDTSLAVVSELPVTIAPPAPDVWHDIDAKMVRRRLKWRRAALTWCFQRVAQYQRGLAGTLVAHFTITRDGHVVDASVDGELDNDEIKSCLARELSTIEFPDSDIATRVNYPLTFVQRD